VITDFREAHIRLASKDRSIRDKRVALADVPSLVADGDTIGVGGCLYSRTPMASLMEVLRSGKRDLTLARSLTSYEAELFMVRGAASRIVTSWFGIGLPWGISKVLREYVEGGQVQYDEWSHLGLGLRFRAAAMGLPFLPTLSMLGSDLAVANDLQLIDDPYTGQRVCLVPALFPDVAMIHVHRADRFGNAQIEGYPFMDSDIASAAQTVVVTTEELVEPEEIVRTADATVIPHFVVDAVVEVPFGAFPHECYGRYEADFDHFEAYVQAINQDGSSAVETYLKRHLDEPGDFVGFLALFGPEVLASQQERARELVGE
jgi:glutaconate CoA-transferase, subunit A